jgi:regulator of RNase E activity RraB
MEEAHDTYSAEDDVRGMYVHLGFEGTNSNGHREEIGKYVSMMKIIKNLQKDVQIHQADNERIMRAKEKIEASI